MKHTETQYGFEYGPVLVERCCSDEKKGWVVINITTKKHPNGIKVYVTKSGKVVIYDNQKEWKPSEMIKEGVNA